MYGFYGGSTQSGDNQTPEKSSRQNEENEEKDKGEQVGGMEDPGENGEGPVSRGEFFKKRSFDVLQYYIFYTSNQCGLHMRI